MSGKLFIFSVVWVMRVFGNLRIFAPGIHDHNIIMIESWYNHKIIMIEL